VELNPDETPFVTASTTDLNICQGDSITLTSSVASSYTWSNGATTQSITVSQSDNYTVTVPGYCQNWTSSAVTLNVNPAPAPVANDVTLFGPGIANLSATGNLVSWYDVPSGGSPIGSGANYTSPFLTSDTYYYVEDTYYYGGGTEYTGQEYHTGMSLFSGNTTNASLIFDVLKACTLKSVKVYTDIPGNRIIELRDNNNVVLQSATVNVPVDSSTVTLNFALAPGTNYHLSTNETLNDSLLGTISPRLQRSNTGVMYPYTINNYINILTSDQGLQYYYYFYNWEVIEPPDACISERIPVFVDITSVGIDETMSAHVSVFPNPANDKLNISFDRNFSTSTTLEITDVSGRVLGQKIFGKISAGQTVQMDLEEYAAGLYMLNIKNENVSVSKSFSIVQ
jgi:hypothetical protein